MPSIRTAAVAAAVAAVAAVVSFSLTRESPPPSDPGGPPVATAAPSTSPAVATAARIPLHFEPAPDGERFVARGGGYVLDLARGRQTVHVRDGDLAHSVGVEVVGGADVAPRAEAKLPGASNYFIGNEPRRWRSGVPHHARVRYAGVYPGVDLVWYGNGGEVQYDFEVAPGADPTAIALRYDGVESAAIDADGTLRLALAHGELRQRRPFAYQVAADGTREPVAAGFRLVEAGDARATAVAFTLGEYDVRRPLVIDPVITYATYLGGTSPDNPESVAIDANGAAWIAGWTDSADFPAAGGVDTSANGNADAFVAKLNPQGTAFEFVTYLGGSNFDEAYRVVVDAAGNAYVAGGTASANFPTAGPAAQATYGGGGSDAFVAKLNPQGTVLLYSTFVGGGGSEAQSGDAFGFAVDGDGAAYVSGETTSANFPTTPGAPQTTLGGGSDYFLTKLAPGGSSVAFATYHGGNSSDDHDGNGGETMVLGANGNVWLYGQTSSTTFPTTPGAIDATLGGITDVFIARFDTVAGTRVYSTLLGGTGNETAFSIAVDAAGNAYVTVETPSTDFPTTPGAYDTTYTGGASDAAIAKLNPQGTALVYSTYLGGTGADQPTLVRVDAAGQAFVAGGTTSANFPVTPGAPDVARNGSNEGFVTKLNASGSGLVYSTYVGTSGSDGVFELQIDGAGAVYATVNTTGTDGATFGGGRTYPGGGDEYFVKLNAAGTAFLDAGYVGGEDDDAVLDLAIDGQDNAWIVGWTTSESFPVTAGAPRATKPGPDTDEDGFVLKLATTPEVAALPGSLAFTGTSATVAEGGGSVTLTVVRSGGSSGAVGVTCAASSGTATQGADFAATSTVLSWANGDSASKTCSVPILQDATDEPDETFTVALSGATGGASVGAPSSVTVTITDDDAAPSPSLSLSATSLQFGSRDVGTTSAVQTVTVTNGGTAALAIGTVAKSGAEAADFAIASDSCSGQSIAAAGTCVIGVTFTPSAAGARSAALSIPSNAAGSPASVALGGTGTTPAPQPGTVQFSAATYSGTENGGSVTVTLTRNAGTDGAISVSVSSGGGSAAAGTDYVAVQQTVSWAAGDGAAKTVTVTLTNDTVDEPDETFTLALANPSGGATLGTQATATVTIVDDDVAPPVTQPTNAGGSYGGGGTFDRLALLLLVPLALLRRLRGACGRLSRAGHVGRSAAAALALTTPVAHAAEPGWFVSASAARIGSTLDGGEIAGALAARGFAASVDADRERFGWGVHGGYRWSKGLQLQLGWIELGEYEVNASTTTANPAAFASALADVLGAGGNGVTLTAGWEFALGTRVALVPRAGVVRWESERTVSAGAARVALDDDGVDATAGLSLVLRVGDRWDAVASFDQYWTGPRNDLRVLGAGLRWRFR